MVANQPSSFQLTILSLVKTELYLYKKMSIASKIPKIVQGTDTIFIIGKKVKIWAIKIPGKRSCGIQTNLIYSIASSQFY